MADIETLLGLYSAPGEDMRALARRLRGQQALGDVLSLSTIPQVQEFGQGQQASALQAAQRGGALRQAAEAAQAQQERFDVKQQAAADAAAESRRRWDYEQQIEQAEREREQAMLGDPMTFMREDGTYVTLQPNALGEFSEDISGLRQVGKSLYAGSQAPLKSKDRYGNNILVPRTGGDAYYPDGTLVSEAEGLRRAEQRSTQEAGAAGAKKGAQETAKSRVERLTDALASRQSMRDAVTQTERAVQALRSGAQAGPVAAMLPTFRASTVQLENARDALAMANISQHTFGSLSEAEAKWLRQVSIPMNLDEDYLLPMMMHAAEAAKRLQAAHEYEVEMLQQGLEPDRKVTDSILHRGGFSFVGPSKDDIDAGRHLRKPEGVSDEVWEPLSAEKKQYVIDNLK